MQYKVVFLPVFVFLMFVQPWAGASSTPMLKTPTGTSVPAEQFKFFMDRPNVLNFLHRIVDGGYEDEMALSVTPKFCPSYSFTAWSGLDPVERAHNRCQARLEKLLTKGNWPSAQRHSCICKLAVKNMTVVDIGLLKDSHRYLLVNMFVRTAETKINKVSGILEYERNDLSKQNVALYNFNKETICSGKVDVKMGSYGFFSGTCMGNQAINKGLFTINCGYGDTCARHMVGNMVIGNTTIGFVSALNDKEISRLYPMFPEKFDLIDGEEKTDDNNY